MRLLLSLFFIMSFNASFAYDYEQSEDFAFKAFLLEQGLKPIGKNQVAGYRDDSIYIASFNRDNHSNEITLSAVIKKPVSSEVVAERFGGFCSLLATTTSFSDHLHDYFDDLALLNLHDMDLTQIEGIKVLSEKSVDLGYSEYEVNYKVTINNQEDDAIYGVCTAKTLDRGHSK